jgi:long-chain acyl-CoA synthetase
VRRKGAQLEVRQLKDWAAERVERDKIPDAIHFVDELPVGNTGKADRGAVAKVVRAGGA